MIKKLNESLQEQFNKPNKGSFCIWHVMNLLHIPKREPDKITKSGRKYRIYNPIDEFDHITEFQDNTVISGVFNGNYVELFNIGVDEDSDLYFVYECKENMTESKYWYGKAGVYRLSNHWGYVAHSNWELTDYFDNELQLGYANYNNFNPRH